jgi:hypothetical protein
MFPVGGDHVPTSRAVRPSRPLGWGLAVGLLLAGCAAPDPASSVTTGSSSTSPRSATSSAADTATASTTVSATASAQLVVANGPGWHESSIDGPAPPPGTCQYGGVAGLLLPDRTCTPGAVDPAVSQANLSQTLCRKGGYTTSVRPPQPVTDAFKKLARSAYSSPGPSSDYELDHLVPLGLGGASDARNLWPEPNQGDPRQFDQHATGGSNGKDGVESRLNRAVCAGQVTLTAAQTAIADNWYTAEQTLGVQP